MMWYGSVTPIMWQLVWVVMLVLVSGWWCSCDGCLKQERIALLQLKASINHPNCTFLQSWVDGKESSNCCQWERVECNTTTGRVIRLSLNHTRELRGLGQWNLNASMFLPFEELRFLYLEGNDIAGWFENEGSEKLSSRLSNLQALGLSYNNLKLDNSFLSSLSGFSSLKYLSLTGNQLISIEGFERISQTLSNLENLDLSYNMLNSSILSSLNGLSSLKYLFLVYNQIQGSIHIRDLKTLHNLEVLELSGNAVDSFVTPKGYKNFIKLKVLALENVKSNASILLKSLRPFSSLKTLVLRDNNLRGTSNIAQDLHDLSNLEALFLDRSFLNKNFLQSIGVMTSLKVISLFACGLNGAVPAQGLCKLKNLQMLDLSQNDFEGLLPSCLGNLTSLQVLDLSNNQFTGNVASSPLSSLTLLEYLSFSNNHFQVPVSFISFANHSNLKVILSNSNTLIVEPNQFPTCIPRFQLKIFSLSECTFSGLNIAPPNFLFHQNDLRYVDLSHNNFGGNFPTWLLENNTRLQWLYLTNNSFTGSCMLPSHPNPYLVRLDVSNNNISGQIPRNISLVFPKLSVLNLSRNAFEGNIASSLGDLKSLTILDLSNNLLSGGIPVDLAMGSTSIYFIKLSNNKLQGQIFPRLVNPTTLRNLILDGNNFVGEIPDSLSHIDLYLLDISDNHFSGQLPRWMGNSSNLFEIYMHKNHLEGPIPVEFCKLTFLKALDLSGNNISGSIPSCFNPPGIIHVHLNKNKLSGLMTRAFYNCSSLVILDLSENNLQGSIPNWIDTLSSLSILLLKDNHFEGRIPIQLCHTKQLSLMDLSHNNFSGPIPPCLSDPTFDARTEKYYVRNFSIQDFTLKDFSMAYLGNSWMLGLDSYSQAYSLYFIVEQVEFKTKSNSYSFKGNFLKFMSGADLSCNQLTGEIPPEIGNLSQIHALNLSHNNLIGPIPPTLSNLRQIESLDLSYNHLNGRIPNQLTELNFLAVFSVAHNNLSGTTPERKAQFGTFEESSYEGNPLLCGLPLNKSCPRTGSPSVALMSNSSNNGEGEDSGFIDMNVFYVSFIASYTTVLLAIALVLYINPYWRRAWFYLIELGITSCYYFVLDNFPKFPVFKRHV